MLRLAVVLHLVLAVSAVGAATHAAVFARTAPGSARLRRLAAWSVGLTVAAMAVGAVVYPRYKLDVRIAWLEANAPGAARLFDLKEQLVALAFPLQVGLVLLLRKEAAAPPLQRLLATSAAALLWSAALLASWVTVTHAWR